MLLKSSHESQYEDIYNSKKKVKIHFKSGIIYEGEILKKRFHGQGRLYWKNGSKYEGTIRKYLQL